MNVRPLTEADEQIVRPLWEELDTELPAPPSYEETWEEAWHDLGRHTREGAAFLSEDDDGPTGFVFAGKPLKGRSHITDIYVRPRARRQGVATALIAEVARAVRPLGAERVSLSVEPKNRAALALYERLGFAEVSRRLAVELDALDARLVARPAGPSYGSVHVQTDDVPVVERAVRQFVPRLPGHSLGTVISPPRNGWITVYDELCDRDHSMLRRLARELSDRMGAVVLALGVEEGSVVRFILLERGRVVDEYLSVPEYYGPLPPGDVIAMAANPTAVARLTGADPGRVRALARTASSPADLPPAEELLGELADALGLPGGDYGFEKAHSLPGALLIERS